MPYIVCRNAHPFRAARIHDTLDEAKIEAERLCRKELDIFLVFQLVGEVALADPPLVWTMQEIPASQSPTATGYCVHCDQVAACAPTAAGGWRCLTCGNERAYRDVFNAAAS